MTAYLSTLCVIAAAAIGSGWWLGRRRRPDSGKLSPVVAGTLLAPGILWLLGARFARNYADTDGFGTDVAGWFAQSGKWLVLLGAMLFSHGWVCGTRQTPDKPAMRYLYYVAVLGMTALVVSRTVPVYFLLDDGRRDTNGILRQSKQIEVTCGAVALLNYLERYQHHAPLTEREVARICGVTPEGTTPAGLVGAARYYGLTNAVARVLTLSQLDQAALPAIVSISTLPTVHHATLLIKLDGEQAWFIDPAYGLYATSRQRFQETWYGRTVLLQ